MDGYVLNLMLDFGKSHLPMSSEQEGLLSKN